MAIFFKLHEMNRRGGETAIWNNLKDVPRPIRATFEWMLREGTTATACGRDTYEIETAHEIELLPLHCVDNDIPY